MACSPTPQFGTVTVGCVEGAAIVTNGSCGMPCKAGMYSSRSTRFYDLSHQTLVHNTYAWMSCPAQVSGMIKLSCYDGIVSTALSNCGERCEAQSLVLDGASFAVAQMDHEAMLT